MTHTIQVDDLVWNRAAQESGLANPAARLRAELAAMHEFDPRDREAALSGRLQAWLREQRGGRRQARAEKPEEAERRQAVAAAKPRLSGTVFTMDRPTRHPEGTICDTCGALVRIGDEAIIYGRRGAKNVDCLDCYVTDRSPVTELKEQRRRDDDEDDV